MTQVGILPPTFLIFCNHPDGVEDSYTRFLTSALRDALGMDGIPLRVVFKQRH